MVCKWQDFIFWSSPKSVDMLAWVFYCQTIGTPRKSGSVVDVHHAPFKFCSFDIVKASTYSEQRVPFLFCMNVLFPISTVMETIQPYHLFNPLIDIIQNYIITSSLPAYLTHFLRKMCSFCLVHLSFLCNI